MLLNIIDLLLCLTAQPILDAWVFLLELRWGKGKSLWLPLVQLMDDWVRHRMQTKCYMARIHNLHLWEWQYRLFPNSYYRRIVPNRVVLSIVPQFLEIYESGQVEMPKYPWVVSAVTIGIVIGWNTAIFMRCVLGV